MFPANDFVHNPDFDFGADISWYIPYTQGTFPAIIMITSLFTNIHLNGGSDECLAPSTLFFTDEAKTT